MVKGIVLFFLITIGATVIIGCSAFGTRPGNNKKKEYSKSKNFDSEKEVFLNRKAGIIEEMWKRNFTWKNVGEFFFRKKEKREPRITAEIKPSLKEFL